MTALEAAWQHHFVETNRIRLHCVTQGEGDLVVLLHGFPEFWYSWRYQIPALARNFKVVVPDLRGYNDSDKPDSGYDLDTLAADIKGLIESLGYVKAHIVGHDWGGAIAWNLAQKFPQHLNQLVILNAPHPHRWLNEMGTNLDQLRRSWYVFAFQVPGLPEWLIQQNLKEFVKNIFREQATRKSAFTADLARIYQEALAKPGVLSGALNYYRHLMSPLNWVHNLGREPSPVTVPTLVLWGEDDSFWSKSFTEGLDKLIKAPFEIKFIPQCGHWIQQEVPHLVNRELLNFLGKSSV
ncbi:MAG: alpha/beta hydrolase [Oscillatoriaceae cyanobacterium]